MTPQLSRGIDSGGPYKAEPVGPYGWWIVTDKLGTNVARFDTKTGRTCGSETEAKAAAEMFNKP